MPIAVSSGVHYSIRAASTSTVVGFGANAALMRTLDHLRLDDELEIGEPAGQADETDKATRNTTARRAFSGSVRMTSRPAQTAAIAPKTSGGSGEQIHANCAAAPSAAAARANRNSSQFVRRPSIAFRDCARGFSRVSCENRV